MKLQSAESQCRTLLSVGLVVLALALLHPQLCRAQLSPAGAEFGLNSYTTGGQEAPVIASTGASDFVVSWWSWGSPGSDQDYGSIQTRRFRPDGVPYGQDQQVNSTDGLHQSSPAIAANSDGTFVVAWKSDTTLEGYAVLLQRFAASGARLGGETPVNSYTTGAQQNPSVAPGADGEFVVVWDSQGSSGTDTSGTSILAQRFSAAGVPLGPEFQVNSHTPLDQTRPRIASDAGGNFLVVWTSASSPGGDTSGESVQARHFASDGSALGPQFQVNAYTTGHQARPELAMRPGGESIVTWWSQGSAQGDNASRSIQARMLSSDASPLGSDLQVNAYGTGDQADPDVAVDASGTFVVVWRSDQSLGSDHDGTSIHTRLFSPLGEPLSDDAQVNTYTTSDQRDPAVSMDADGNFLVTWQSFGSSGPDTSSWSIQARRFDGLFRDGFELGNYSRWSLTAP